MNFNEWLDRFIWDEAQMVSENICSRLEIPFIKKDYQPERLKRAGIVNDEAKVRSANIEEIAEANRND